MASISTQDARALFTKMLIATYKERVAPSSFFRSFFKEKVSSTLELSIEVQRGTEKIAVDVERGTEGNRNNFSRSTEKIFIPPYYREYFDATQLSLYDRLFGDTSIDSGVFSAFLEQVAEKIIMLQDKIDRAYEKQCADVLTTGIVSLNGGTNIDFKRKAASLLDLVSINANRYWTDNTNSKPYDDLLAGCKFIREVGKSTGATLNAVMGATALNTFLSNTKVKERADIRNYSLDNINAPQRASTGASLHGQVSVGAYNLNLWSYPDIYESNGVATPYMDEKKVIILPENPNFVMGFGVVPQLATQGMPVKGKFVVSDYTDERNATHIFDVKSAGVAIPVGIDQIYTVKVIA